MRLIKEFKWCRRYGLKTVEVDYNLNNKNVIIYRANKIKRLKHMIEVIRWIKQFGEYRKTFDKHIFFYLWRWKTFNWFNKKNDYLTF